MAKLIALVIKPIARAFFEVYFELLAKHRKAEMVGGGDETGDAVNDSVRKGVDHAPQD